MNPHHKVKVNKLNKNFKVNQIIKVKQVEINLMKIVKLNFNTNKK